MILKQKNTQSLQKQLSRALSILALLFALVAAVVVGVHSYWETHDFQDDLLKNAARHITPQNTLADDDDDDDDAKIYTQSPDTPHQHQLDVANLSDGYHTVLHNENFYRVYVNGKIAVWQNMEERNELILQAILYGTLPLLLLIPLFYALTWWVVRRVLRPVAALSGSLKTRRDTDLTPLPVDNAPRELHDLLFSFNDLLQRTERAMQQQQRFIADAAHELRTPMTALSVQAERLQNHALPENLQNQINELQNGIRRNRQLLEQLLQHAHTQASNTQNPRNRLDLQAIFKNVVQDLLPIAQAKDQDFGVNGDFNPPIFANETEIYVLIKTLCDNALRYTPRGGQIDLSASQTENEYIIHIEDNGIGIAQHERERVFDPFYRILGGDEEGSGLGLSIAQNIVQRYGGSIELRDSRQFESGLWVLIYLPKNAVQAA